MTVRELNETISSLEDVAIFEPDGREIVKLNRYPTSATIEAFGDFVVDEIQYNTTRQCFGLYLKSNYVKEV